MNILIYSDVHWCQDSSIVRSMGKKYSTRLEYIIASLNWAEELSKTEKCELVANLGDTFDRPNLNAMELTALREVRWNDEVEHIVIVGNHDSDIKSLEYSSSAVFETMYFSDSDIFRVVSEPVVISAGKRRLCFLPYTIESDRQPLTAYTGTEDNSDVIFFSHNDIKNVQLGKYKSAEGFDLEEIEANSSLFLNGHIHNQGWVSSKILDVGNLCGKTFNEDAGLYPHGVWILDTDTLELKFIENPFALNFYKLTIDEEHPTISSYDLKKNLVLNITCDRKYAESVREEMKSNPDIVAGRLTISEVEERGQEERPTLQLEKTDYLDTFADFVKEKIGNSDLVIEELAAICS